MADASQRSRAALWPLLRLLGLASATLRCSTGERPPTGVTVAVRKPAALAHLATLGLLANFSARGANGKFSAWAPPAEDPEGCRSLRRAPLAGRRSAVSPGPAATAAAAARPRRVAVARRTVALVRRGGCSFAQKARNARAAGAAALLVIWDSDDVQHMTSEDYTEVLPVAAVAIQKTVGDALLTLVREGAASGEAAVIALGEYHPPAWDFSGLVLIGVATAIVVLGAFVAAADLRPGSPFTSHEHEVLELDNDMTIAYFVLGSAMLLALFYFMQYIIHVVTAAFCISGLISLTSFGGCLLTHACPALRRRLPGTAGAQSIGESIALFASILVVAGWLVYRSSRHGWLFQDIIATALLCMMQRTLRLPNLRTAALLLTLMFIYDVFWVFISPAFFGGKSVMMEVARGAGATQEVMPMLLRIPSFLDPYGTDRLLGFGDVFLPGLLLSLLLRFDLHNGRSWSDGYFWPAVLGYAVGLVITLVALAIMRHGQPALLYLVPATLGTTLALAKTRSELHVLWGK